MIELVPNAAFRGLNRALGLAGARNLGAIDLAVASPVLDLTDYVRAGVGTRWNLRARTITGGAVTSSFTTDPFQLTNWAEIIRDGQTLSTPFAEAVPRSHEAVLLRVDVQYSAAITEGVLAFQTGAIPIVGPVWRATTKVTGLNALFPDFTSLPIPLAPGNPNSPLRFYYDVTAAGTLDVMLTVFSAPAGVLSIYRA